MNNDLEKIRLFYMLMGFQQKTIGSSLLLSKEIAGSKVCLFFSKFDGSDEDGLLALIEESEKQRQLGNNAVIISKLPPSSEMINLAKAYDVILCTLRDWLFQATNSDEISRVVLSDANKIKNFVEPVLYPIPSSSLLEWVSNFESEEIHGSFMLLHGPAGYGKTTYLNWLAGKCAEKHISDTGSDSAFPIFLSLEEYRNERQWDELISSYARKQRKAELTPEAIQFLLDNRIAILFIDGVDELAERGGENIAKATLETFSQVTDTGRVIVSVRESYATDIIKRLKNKSSIVSIKGIAEASIAEFLKGYAGNVIDSTSRILGDLSSESTEIKSNPLFIKTLADVLSDNSGFELSSSESSSGLVFAVLDQYNIREQQRQNTALKSSDYSDLFQNLAYEAVVTGRRGGARNSLEIPMGKDFVTLFCENAVKKLYTDPKTLQSELSRCVNSVISSEMLRLRAFTTEPLEAIEFRHEFYRDYYCAKDVATKLLSGVDPNVSLLDIGENISNIASEYILGKHESSFEDLLQRFHGAKVQSVIIQGCLNSKPADGIIDAKSITTSWAGINAVGVVFKRIAFKDVDFSGSDLTKCTFIGCHFMNCNVRSVVLTDTEFSSCYSDETTHQYFLGHGITIPSKIVAETAKSPIREKAEEIVRAFFERFVRKERGFHQRTVNINSFYRGLDQIESEITKECVIPFALKERVIEAETSIDVYVFNSKYQNVADQLIFDGVVCDEIERLVADIESQL